MKPETRSYLWGPLVVLLIALAATGTVVWQLLHVADAEDARRFQRYVGSMQQALEDQLDAYVGLLRDASTLFAENHEPTSAQFRNFVAQLKLATPLSPPNHRFQSAEGHYPGLLGMGWLKLEPAGARHSVGSSASPMPLDAGKGERLRFLHLEPRDWRNQALAGYEMFTDPTTRDAMARARDTGRPAMSGKVTVIREFWSKKHNGFHLFLPIYHGVPNSRAARRQALRGFLIASVQADEMLAALRPDEASRDIDIQIYDGTQTAPAALLYTSDASRTSWEPNYRPRFSTTVATEGPGRSWAAVFYTRPEFDLASSRAVVPHFLLVGVLVSLLLAGINLVQRRAAAALNASEVRYRRLFEASPDGVFLFDADSGRISSVNPAMTELLGRTREELVGKFIWEIGLFADETGGQAAFRLLQQKNYHRFHHLPILTPGGQRHDVEFTCNAYMASQKRFMQCNVRNITDRMRAELALRESEERYRSLVEISPQGVWIVDRDGEPLFVNRYWVEYSGIGLEAAAAGGWTEQVHPDDREKMAERWHSAREDDSLYEFELRMRRAADGAYRWHLARGVPVHDENGRIDKWLGVFIDIDERKRAEESRVHLLRREYALRTQAEAANQAKDDFLATLSHELRTPLNAILGWTQTLQQGEADRATVRRALAQIDASANAQARLINDLLNVADIGSGRLRLDVQAVNLIPLVHSAIESLRPEIGTRELSTRLDPDADCLYGDPARLEQIIWNLLSNAVKFTAPGGHITVSLARAGSMIELCVSDDGEGISSEFLPHVFDPFRQADASSKRRHGGLGIGLAIVRQLTELHAGGVTADSAGEGLGSKFIVKLPIHPGQEIISALASAQRGADSSRLDAPPPARSPRRLTGLRILSVDDDPNTREMLQEALQRAGAVVESAASAPEALDKLQSFRPHVLLSDIGLPEEDGYDLLRKVRALNASSGGAIPAVALTGYAREQDYQAALAAGYQAFVAKPVNLEELWSAILRASAQSIDA
jgi:PAS domain S-box-containing protein